MREITLIDKARIVLNLAYQRICSRLQPIRLFWFLSEGLCQFSRKLIHNIQMSKFVIVLGDSHWSLACRYQISLSIFH